MLAQRLVRKICNNCKRPIQLPEEALHEYGVRLCGWDELPAADAIERTEELGVIDPYFGPEGAQCSAISVQERLSPIEAGWTAAPGCRDCGRDGRLQTARHAGADG